MPVFVEICSWDYNITKGAKFSRPFFIPLLVNDLVRACWGSVFVAENGQFLVLKQSFLRCIAALRADKMTN